jgi:hypothetical protein
MVDTIGSHSVQIQKQDMEIRFLENEVKTLKTANTTLRTEVAAF